MAPMVTIRKNKGINMAGMIASRSRGKSRSARLATEVTSPKNPDGRARTTSVAGGAVWTAPLIPLPRFGPR